MSADWYVSPEAEQYVGQNARRFKACEDGRSCHTVRDHVRAIQQTLVPILYEHGVDFCEWQATRSWHDLSAWCEWMMTDCDFYDVLVLTIDNAGHIHDYTVSWPLDEAANVTQRDYVNPRGTIYICEGNGGVPMSLECLVPNQELKCGYNSHSGRYPCGTATRRTTCLARRRASLTTAACTATTPPTADGRPTTPLY